MDICIRRRMDLVWQSGLLISIRTPRQTAHTRLRQHRAIPTIRATIPAWRQSTEQWIFRQSRKGCATYTSACDRNSTINTAQAPGHFGAMPPYCMAMGRLLRIQIIPTSILQGQAKCRPSTGRILRRILCTTKLRISACKAESLMIFVETPISGLITSDCTPLKRGLQIWITGIQERRALSWQNAERRAHGTRGRWISAEEHPATTPICLWSLIMARGQSDQLL